MTFDLQHILASKRAYGRRLAELPVGEKLRMLDVLRERELAIRGVSGSEESASFILREEPTSYRVKKSK